MRSPLTTLRNGILAPLHEYGFKLYLGIMFSYGWTMFGLNLLTLALCVPVVTAPSAICALNRVLMKITLDGQCRVMKEYWAEFKSSFPRVLPFFSISAAVSTGLGIAIFILLSAHDKGLTEYIILGVCILAGVFIYLVFTYAVILLVTVDLPIRTNLKNALLLTLTQPKRDLYIIIMPFALTLFTALFLPKTIVIIALLMPTFTTLMSCIIIKPLLEEEILLSDE